MNINKPKKPFFSSGPCNKHPNYNISLLERAFTSRSHRSKDGVERYNKMVGLTREILNIPENFFICMIMGGCTAAMETAIWNLLGYIDIDSIVMDPFSKKWYSDIVDELKLDKKVNVNVNMCKYGNSPKNIKHNPKNDIIFVWNATPTGVYIPNLNWIKNKREGLVIVDGTSITFGLPVDWDKIDVLAYSWQKILGGEAGHGMLILSERAIKRLEIYTPEYPIPTLYQLKKNNKIKYQIFKGGTNNTFSFIALEDHLMALEWVKDIGGVKSLSKKIINNYNEIKKWVHKSDWVNFVLGEEYKEFRSPINSCIEIKNIQREDLIKILEENKVAYDIKGHKSMPSNIIRIWNGPTVDIDDIKYLLEWLDSIYIELSI